MSNNQKPIEIKDKSTSTSSCSQNTSLYETPMNSPPNDSLLDSTTLDSLALDPNSNDLLSSRQSVLDLNSESRCASIATNETLKAQHFETHLNLFPNISMQSTNDESLYGPTNPSLQYSQNMQNMMSSIPQSSIWFRRQSICPNVDSNASYDQKYGLLLKCLEELDCEHLQIIGLEQQINSISLQCKTIRENIVSKTNCIYSLINDIIRTKESAQTQTQTPNVSQIGKTKSTNSQHLDNRENRWLSHYSSSDMFSKDRNEPKLRTSYNENRISHETTHESNPTKHFDELSEDLKQKLYRLSALVKGYLIRRLMKTDKVVYIVNTIRDTTQLLLNFKNSPPNRALKFDDVTPEDVKFHKRLIIQLENACHEFYDIFFNYPKSSQMQLISRSRQRIRERHYRTGSVLSTTSNLTSVMNSSLGTSPTHLLSSVTRKILEKKLENSQNMSAFTQTQPICRSFTSKTSSNSISKKPTASSTVTSPEMALPHDSINRSKYHLRRNHNKTKVHTFKRKSPNKRK